MSLMECIFDEQGGVKKGCEIGEAVFALLLYAFDIHVFKVNQ